MEVLNISKTSIIILFTKEDMKKYSIDTGKGSPATELKGVFRRAFAKSDDASAKSNSPAGERLLVQVFESKEGGCEMFVTKINGSTGLYSQGKYIHMLTNPIYAFGEMENLLLACKSLRQSGYIGESTLYKEKNGRRIFLETDEEYSYLSEFGARLMDEGAWYYMREHCIVVCQNAVDKLSKLTV